MIPLLLATLLLFPVCNSEWRRTTTSISVKDKSENKKHFERFSKTIFYVGNPHVTYDLFTRDEVTGKLTNYPVHGAQYYVYNTSAPIPFEGIEYYWREESMDKDVKHICECSIGSDGHFYSVRAPNALWRIQRPPQTRYRDAFNNSRLVEALYYGCGVLNTCDGLQCLPPSATKIGVVCGTGALVISGIALALFGFRKLKRDRLMAKENRRRELEGRTIGSGGTGES